MTSSLSRDIAENEDSQEPSKTKDLLKNTFRLPIDFKICIFFLG
jgi:hypothetical protein